MTQPSLFQQVLDYSSRANPYPLYAQLREIPVRREENGGHVGSTYRGILALLGVPPEDEPRFSVWAEKLVNSLDADPASGPSEAQREGNEAAHELAGYMAGLIQARCRQPGDDILSGLATDDGPDGRMSPEEI